MPRFMQMLLKLREYLNKLLTLDRRILIVGAAAFLAVLMAAAAGVWSLQSTGLSLLYGNLSKEDSRQVVRFLDNNGIKFSLRDDDKSIYVDFDAVTNARIILAQEGLPSRATVGYELFNEQSSVGTSSLVQEVNKLRALEGELTRTIVGIKSVQHARVHLVLPRRELFSREKLKPTASVVVTMEGRKTLSSEQAQAILHIVATAVSDLKTEDITLADNKGRLLARGGQGLGQLGGRTPEEIQLSYETRLARQVEAILENVVGQGKVRTEIRADMDFSRRVINQEVFDPDGQVVRSEENIEETGSKVRIPPDPVTVQNNIPENDLLTSPQPTENEQNSRTEERINYEISREETNTIIPPGKIDRLSVAVLVDGIYKRGPNGVRSYEPRSEEEMLKIEKLVKSAIGFNSIDRRDQLEIINLQFSTSQTLGNTLEPLVFGIPAGDFRQLIEALVLATVILLIAFWVVRPLWSKLLGDGQDEVITLIGADGKPILVNKRTGLPVKAIAGATGQTTVAPDGTVLDADGNPQTGLIPGNSTEELANLTNLQARIRSNIVKQLNSLVKQYPSESSNILREWISQK